jgi:hypothetical protein
MPRLQTIKILKSLSKLLVQVKLDYKILTFWHNTPQLLWCCEVHGYYIPRLDPCACQSCSEIYGCKCYVSKPSLVTDLLIKWQELAISSSEHTTSWP